MDNKINQEVEQQPKCHRCKCYRDISDFVNSKGKKLKTCIYCRNFAKKYREKNKEKAKAYRIKNQHKYKGKYPKIDPEVHRRKEICRLIMEFL